jgi:ubiquinone/menaquinone biosynthesis C-methylase UbiE
MSIKDIFSDVDKADDATLNRIVKRLEAREEHPQIAQWRKEYIHKFQLCSAGQILENGCGTGVVTRLLARETELPVQLFGSDNSAALIAVARQRAIEEGLQDRIAYTVTDAHALDFEDASFDVVIADTLISHVVDPNKVTAEIARVVKPDGIAVIFDGDYTSLSFAYTPDPGLGKAMDEALRLTAYTNPNIMRDLPRMLRDYEMELITLVPYALVEIGAARDRLSFIETHTRRTSQTGLVTAKQMETWLAWQYQAMQEGYFFGVCNYYVYIVRRICGRKE